MPLESLCEEISQRCPSSQIKNHYTLFENVLSAHRCSKKKLPTASSVLGVTKICPFGLHYNCVGWSGLGISRTFLILKAVKPCSTVYECSLTTWEGLIGGVLEMRIPVWLCSWLPRPVNYSMFHVGQWSNLQMQSLKTLRMFTAKLFTQITESLAFTHDRHQNRDSVSLAWNIIYSWILIRICIYVDQKMSY